MPSGLTALSDKKIMSVFLSYSPSTAPSLAVGLVTLGSNIMSPASVFANVVVDKISLLTTRPVSPNPAACNFFCSSFANLFVRPSCIVSAKLNNLGSSSLGGNTFSCLTSSDVTKLVIASSDNLFLPKDLSLSSLPRNSSGVSLNPSCLLATVYSKSSVISYLFLPSTFLALPLPTKSLTN